jgi:GntR family transcriptional regulator
LYCQLEELIREKIATGEWQPGDLIPSERELSEKYSISRMTARQAMNELANEGLLRRVQGKGTCVAKPKIEQRLARLTGFTQDMRKRGLRPGARVLRLEMVAPPRLSAEALQIDPHQSVVLLERLRIAGDEPMALETCYLHFDRAPGLLEESFEDCSLYELLTETYDVVPSRAEQQMEAGLCSRRERKLLGLQEGAPVLKNRRITFDQRNRPFEYTESVYRGDRYVFYAELTTL